MVCVLEWLNVLVHNGVPEWLNRKSVQEWLNVLVHNGVPEWLKILVHNGVPEWLNVLVRIIACQNGSMFLS